MDYLQNLILVGRYLVVKKVSSGVYLAKNIQDQKSVIIKLSNRQDIVYQGKLLQILQGGPSIPHMHWCGQDQSYFVIVLQNLGETLFQLHQKLKRFSLKTTFMIADKILNALQFLHFKNIIYNRLTAKDFILGKGKYREKIYFSSLLNATYQKKQYPEKLENLLHQFVSPNVLNKCEYQKRDDLISLGFMLIYFYKGKLPWVLPYKPTPNVLLEFRQQMLSLIKTDLVSNIPKELKRFINYALSLKRGQIPNIQYLKGILRDRFFSQGYDYDNVYDWMLIPRNKTKSKDIKFEQLNLQIIPNQQKIIESWLKFQNKKQSKQPKKEVKHQIINPIIKQKKIKQKDHCIIF